MGILQAHISEHVALLAREEITKKNAPLIEQEAQKMGGMLPPELYNSFNNKMNLKLHKELLN